ncbi:MAG: hypothetical protein HQK83_02800 [Fibrobacteria bacterium]|nr:hypothetical protein [Fibrobacteria bacterium]
MEYLLPFNDMKFLAIVLIFLISCTERVDQIWNNPHDTEGKNWFPVSVTAMGDTAIFVQDTITLSATAQDSNGTVELFIWALEGGMYNDTTTTPFIKTVFSRNGVYPVYVRAVDNDGIRSQPDTVLVIVQKGQPDISAMDDIAISVNDSLTITAIASDSNGVIKKYYWALDGINFNDSTTRGTLTTAFNKEGIYTILVKACDDDALYSTIERVTITAVKSVPWVEAMKDTSVFIYDSVLITVEGFDTLAVVEKYYWALDGVHFYDSTTRGSITSTFSASGMHTVLVKARNNDDVFSISDRIMITVSNGVPSVVVSGDTNVPINDLVRLTANGFDSNGVIEKFYWALDGVHYTDSTDSGSIAVNFSELGEHLVLVRVRDDDGFISGSGIIHVDVLAYAPWVTAMNDTNAAQGDSLLVSAVGYDTNGEIIRYIWALDGEHYRDTTLNGNIFVPVTKSGVSFVLVKVQDEDGMISAEDTVIIIATAGYPVLTKVADTVISYIDSLTIFVFVEDRTPGGSILQYYWDIGGDGWDDTTTVPEYTFRRRSSKNRSVVIWGARDNDGLLVKDTFNIWYNAPPYLSDHIVPAEGDTAEWSVFSSASSTGDIEFLFRFQDSDTGEETITYQFEWGIEENEYQKLESDQLPYLQGSYIITLKDLAPITKYYWRLVIEDLFGETDSAQGQFHTRPLPKDTDFFTDNRNSRMYKMVHIGNQTWMAENLNYVPQGGEAWCYQHDSGMCSTYGRLYSWSTVNTDHGNGKDICPIGWHAPSDDEWKILEMAIGISASEVHNDESRGTDEGKKLKSKTWYGSDDFGFNVLPGGYCNGEQIAFYGQRNHAQIWTTSPYESKYAIYRSFVDISTYPSSGDKIGRGHTSREHGLSIRCVKDTE